MEYFILIIVPYDFTSEVEPSHDRFNVVQYTRLRVWGPPAKERSVWS
jgi:hypothetical protein